MNAGIVDRVVAGACGIGVVASIGASAIQHDPLATLALLFLASGLGLVGTLVWSARGSLGDPRGDEGLPPELRGDA